MIGDYGKMENYIGFVLWGGALFIVDFTRGYPRAPSQGFG